MIKNIFFDLDECLLHSMYHEPEQNHLKIILDGEVYYTIVRPCAKGLIEFARELVGNDNVYILTSSDVDYANEINRLAEFGFQRDHIFTRRDLWEYSINTTYGGTKMLPHQLADKDNVLIDNLPPRYNTEKMDFIGIDGTRYHQVIEYYGINFPDETFEEEVKNFLSERME